MEKLEKKIGVNSAFSGEFQNLICILEVKEESYEKVAENLYDLKFYEK